MIQFKTIDGVLLRDMVMAGTAILEKNREAVDALNVFPVPDGDTGTNMSLTMQSATRELNSKEFLRADEAANALAKGALKGARGNSGVITSQLLRGFAKALNGVEKITPVQFAEALMKGSEMAYKAVMTDNNIKQALLPSRCRVFYNDAGTAPGFALDRKVCEDGSGSDRCSSGCTGSSYAGVSSSSAAEKVSSEGGGVSRKSSYGLSFIPILLSYDLLECVFSF